MGKANSNSAVCKSSLKNKDSSQNTKPFNPLQLGLPVVRIYLDRCELVPSATQSVNEAPVPSKPVNIKSNTNNQSFIQKPSPHCQNQVIKVRSEGKNVLEEISVNSSKPTRIKKKTSRRSHRKRTSKKRIKLPPASILDANPTACTYCKKLFSGADFSTEHEVACRANPFNAPLEVEKLDSRGNVQEKVNFLSGLFLTPKCPETNTDIIENPNPDLNLLKKITDEKVLGREERKLVTLFRNNSTLDLSSSLGQKICFLAKRCDIKGRPVLNYNQLHCGYVPKYDESLIQPKSKSRKSKNIKTAAFAHKACFNKRQRVVRNTEIVTGLNKNSWKVYNQCKEISLQISPLSKHDIDALANHNNRDQMPFKIPKKVQIPYPFVCSDLVVELFDLRNSSLLKKIVGKHGRKV